MVVCISLKTRRRLRKIPFAVGYFDLFWSLGLTPRISKGSLEKSRSVGERNESFMAAWTVISGSWYRRCTFWIGRHTEKQKLESLLDWRPWCALVQHSDHQFREQVFGTILSVTFSWIAFVSGTYAPPTSNLLIKKADCNCLPALSTLPSLLCGFLDSLLCNGSRGRSDRYHLEVMGDGCSHSISLPIGLRRPKQCSFWDTSFGFSTRWPVSRPIVILNNLIFDDSHQLVSIHLPYPHMPSSPFVCWS